MPDIHEELPESLRYLSMEMLRLRVHEAGYNFEDKISKDAPTEKDRVRRLEWAKTHKHRSEHGWLSYLQAVGDIKLYGWYPKSLQAKHRRLRVKKTWMLKSEKMKPGFLRPKEWFTREQWKKVRKVRILGFTCSNGATWNTACPEPWNNHRFADIVERDFGPWLVRQFPHKGQLRILLDGERLLHAPAPKAVFERLNFVVLANWPPRSPELNPQENVWSWVEKKLRKEEPKRENYDDFFRRLLRTLESVPPATCRNLIKSMSRRIDAVIERKGGRLRY